MKEVKIYSTPTCPYCRMLKDYLSSKGITYKDVDISDDQETAKEMIRVSGQMGVPVVIIDDVVIIGFEREKIDSLLGL